MQFLKRNLKYVIAFLLLIALALASFKPLGKYYPAVEISVQDDHGFFITRFLFNEQKTLGACDALLGNILRSTVEKCPICTIRRIDCSDKLTAEQKQLLGEAPISSPSGKMGNGVVVFEASMPDMALNACQAAQGYSRSGANPITCYASNESRPQVKKRLRPDMNYLGLCFIAAFISWGVCWLLVRYEHLHAHFSHDHIDSGPQKYHAVPTPRIGGIAIAIGLLVSGSLVSYVEPINTTHIFGLIMLASAPAFIGGLVEDITKRVGVVERLLLTMLSGVMSAWLIGVIINRVDVYYFDQLLTYIPIAVLLTAVATGGLANAINIIDGYNGLAGGFSLLILASFAIVAYSLGDSLIFLTAIIMGGALFGFLRWNWPGGRIFLGDGGAYLLGFILAQLSVLIVIRNPQVSAWYPAQLMIYPIFETFYSIYRRAIKHNLSPGAPDNRHLHQLIHDSHVRRKYTKSNSLEHNSKVAIYLWPAAAVMALSASIFYQSTNVLVLLSAFYCLVYIIVYQRLESAYYVKSSSDLIKAEASQMKD